MPFDLTRAIIRLRTSGDTLSAIAHPVMKSPPLREDRNCYICCGLSFLANGAKILWAIHDTTGTHTASPKALRDCRSELAVMGNESGTPCKRHTPWPSVYACGLRRFLPPPGIVSRCRQRRAAPECPSESNGCGHYILLAVLIMRRPFYHPFVRRLRLPLNFLQGRPASFPKAPDHP